MTIALVVGVGRLVLSMLAWGERLLLALQRRRPLIRAQREKHVRLPDPSVPFRSVATAHDRIERQRSQKEVRTYALARLRHLVAAPEQG